MPKTIAAFLIILCSTRVSFAGDKPDGKKNREAEIQQLKLKIVEMEKAHKAELADKDRQISTTLRLLELLAKIGRLNSLRMSSSN